MKLIVTIETEEYSFLTLNLTTQGLQLVNHRSREEKLIDNRAKNVNRDVYRPFGIAQSDVIYIASQGKIISFSKEKKFPVEEEILSDWFLNTHQILYDKGYLYLTGTSVNCIGRLNLKTKEINYFDTLDLVKTKRPDKLFNFNDRTHTNSLLINGNSLWFLNHNKRLSPSTIVELDKNTFKVLNTYDNVGFDAHNLVFHNNFLYYLSTAEGYLKSIDLKTKEIQIYNIEKFKDVYLASEKIFFRGLCIKDNILYIGATYTSEKDRKKQECYIYTYDIITSNITKIKMPFLGSILDLQEITYE
tara:strand:+ start:187 stop:1092 length:906 start_codon:yes stop_codon:yes gene_type:complete